MKTYSLLIWEFIPEDTVMYLIPNEEADKIRHHLDQAHRRIINVNDMNEGLDFLNTALDTPEYSQYKWSYATGNLPENSVVTHVYHSGFYM